MSASKPIVPQTHTKDGLYQELENIEKVDIPRDSMLKKAGISEEQKEKCPFLSGDLAAKKESKPEMEDHLRKNLIDQISIMNLDQLLEIHNFLKCNDIESVENLVVNK